MPPTFAVIRMLFVHFPAFTPTTFTAVSVSSARAAATRIPVGPSGTNERSTYDGLAKSPTPTMPPATTTTASKSPSSRRNPGSERGVGIKTARVYNGRYVLHHPAGPWRRTLLGEHFLQAFQHRINGCRTQ